MVDLRVKGSVNGVATAGMDIGATMFVFAFLVGKKKMKMGII